jgi:peptide methionine sulfoxide reductase MsrB
MHTSLLVSFYRKILMEEFCPKCGYKQQLNQYNKGVRFCPKCGQYLFQINDDGSSSYQYPSYYDASYKDIQDYIKNKYDVAVKSCWIADVKEHYGLTRGPAHNRNKLGRSNPCPPKYWHMIKEAIGL